MGTSGAFGGTPGWNGARNDTRDWLTTRPSTPTGGDGPNSPADDGISEEGDSGGNGMTLEPTVVDEFSEIDATTATMLAGIAGRLASAIASGSASRLGGRRSASRTPMGRSRGGRAQAASSGGVAIAGTYGLLSGDAGALEDTGLSMDELKGLSPFEQAKRIVDAASGASALIEDDEIREVNANFVWWALQQEGDVTPAEFLKRWITELVFRTWLTETGSVLRDGRHNGADIHDREREVKATLEAAINRLDLPPNGIRAANFERAILDLLGTLTRIFQQAAA